MNSLLTILITALAVSTLLNVLLKRINIPTVIGYIFTGSIIATAFGVHAHGNVELEHIAEFGIVFLMFSLGLEMSIEEIKEKKKELIVYGALQVILTAGIFSLIAHYMFGIEQKVAIVVGLGLSLSSTAIVLKLFSESGEIKTKYGENSHSILLFQDVMLIPIILMITIFTSQDSDLGVLLGKTAINAAITLAVLFVLGKYVLKDFFRIVSNTNSKEIYMGSVLLVIVGSSFLAHAFGFTYTLGAFVAGVLIADTIYKYQIEADLIPFRDLLLGVFFITIGMQINFHVIQESIVIVLGLLAALILIKTLVLFVVLNFFTSSKDALKTGLSLAQTGEAALVVFSLILSNGLLDEKTVHIIILTIVLSMLITPFIVGNLDKIISIFFKKENFSTEILQNDISEDYIVVCGYNSFGQNISEKLDEGNIYHKIVTGNTENFIKARQDNKNVFFGDPADGVLLESLQVRDALNVIIAIDDIEHIERACASINIIDPKINIIVKVQHHADLEKLDAFNIKSVIDANESIASALIDDIEKSKLLAKETSNLQYLNKYDIGSPDSAIELLTLEQRRLLDIISDSFNGLREGKSIIMLKAYHDSFDVLSEIIRNTITDLTTNADLSAEQYTKINILLNNQHMLESANKSLQELGHDLAEIDTVSQGHKFTSMVVDGLDAIFLSLKDISKEYDEDDMFLLKVMTSSDSKGIETIRSAYLTGENDFDQSGKKVLLSAMNLTERLILLFGDIGHAYEKLYTNK